MATCKDSTFTAGQWALPADNKCVCTGDAATPAALTITKGKCLTVYGAAPGYTASYYACDVPAGSGNGTNDSDGAVAFGASMVAATLAVAATMF